MSTEVKTIEEAAEALLENQRQDQVNEKVKDNQEKAALFSGILQAFEKRYADVMGLLVKSGIVVSVGATEDTEDSWAEISFFKPDSGLEEPLRLRVTTYGSDTEELKFDRHEYTSEELILMLYRAMKATKTPEEMAGPTKPTPPAKTPAQLLGSEAAFARPTGNTGDDSANYTNQEFDGLTKREYFAGLAMQGMLAKGHDGHIFDLGTGAVQIADALLNALS